MLAGIQVREGRKEDVEALLAAFKEIGWEKPVETFNLYIKEQFEGKRKFWVATSADNLAGYVTLKVESFYPPFAREGIPEISDLNVLPTFRCRGIGSKLLEVAEEEAFRKSQTVGIGFGLYKDYGSAQRLYIKRGYLPNGEGVTYKERPVLPGTKVCLDDDLVLWLTKKSPKGEAQ